MNEFTIKDLKEKIKDLPDHFLCTNIYFLHDLEFDFMKNQSKFSRKERIRIFDMLTGAMSDYLPYVIDCIISDRMSTKKEDYRDIGLNADWCCSCYELTNSIVIFDNEDNEEFILMSYMFNPEIELRCTRDLFTGSFSECIRYYERNYKK